MRPAKKCTHQPIRARRSRGLVSLVATHAKGHHVPAPRIPRFRRLPTSPARYILLPAACPQRLLQALLQRPKSRCCFPKQPPTSTKRLPNLSKHMPSSTTYHTVGWAQETAFDESQTLARSCQNRPSSSSPPPRKSQNLHQPPQQQTPVSPALHRLRGRLYAAHHTQHSILITIQYQLPPAARAVTPLGFRLACPAQDRGHFLD